jgi:hypothetical protein
MHGVRDGDDHALFKCPMSFMIERPLVISLSFYFVDTLSSCRRDMYQRFLFVAFLLLQLLRSSPMEWKSRCQAPLAGTSVVHQGPEAPSHEVGQLLTLKQNGLRGSDPRNARSPTKQHTRARTGQPKMPSACIAGNLHVWFVFVLFLTLHPTLIPPESGTRVMYSRMLP